MPTTTAVPGGTLAHWAFFYDSIGQYTDKVGSFLSEGLAAGEPALVAVPGDHLAPIRAALGTAGDAIGFADMTVLGRNPSCIIPVIRRFTNAHPGSRTRFVGEPVWAGRTPAEISEATRHEALINTAFAGVSTTILCPYHRESLARAVLDDAELTHPHLMDLAHVGESPRYTGAAAALAIGAQPLPGPPPGAEEITFGVGDLLRLRRLIHDQATGAGLSEERAEDLVLAVNEAVTNTISHASSPGTLRIWREAATLVCEIRDRGRIADPLAGRHLAPAAADGGHGLRVVNQVCDLVELRSGRWGTAVRMHMRTGGQAGAW